VKGWVRLSRGFVIVIVAIVVLLAGCGGPTLAPSVPTPNPGSTATGAQAQSSPTATKPAGSCRAAQLVVGDLPSIDKKWAAGIDAATTSAHAWQPDAFLTALKVSCQLFESDFRWQATFYSPTAQAYYLSDTTEVIPASTDPASVPSLEGQTLTFGAVYRALVKSGYDDSAAISPSTGVDVRFNTDKSPFGPPAEPKNTVIYHLAIERLGETKDVFVDGSNGSVYRYSG
jgi:hypothetical protein